MNMFGISMVVLIISLVFMLLVAMTMGNKRFVLGVSVAILSVMNNSHITKITEPIGIGAPIILMLLVSICLIYIFHINVLKIPRHGGGILGLFIALMLLSTVISVPLSDDVYRSTVTVITFLFLIVIGWIIIGEIYPKFPDKSRYIVIFISDIVGLQYLLSVIFVLIFAGPDALRGRVGGAQSIISLFGVTVSRLQTDGFNATGVGVASAISIFWLSNLFLRYQYKHILKNFFLFLICITFLVLLWSGSRGPIAAFFATWIVINSITLKSRKNIKNFIGLLVLLCGSLYFFNNYFSGIFYRGSSSYETTSFSDLLIGSRFDFVGLNIKDLLSPTFFGHGFGFSSGEEANSYNIESFFVRIWYELGVIGSSIYFLTFIFLTTYIVKVDRYFFMKRERGAMFPSAIFIFTWMNSPTSFGFSLPVGTLAIQLAIASGALFTWRQIRVPKLQAYQKNKLVPCVSYENFK